MSEVHDAVARWLFEANAINNQPTRGSDLQLGLHAVLHEATRPCPQALLHQPEGFWGCDLAGIGWLCSLSFLRAMSQGAREDPCSTLLPRHARRGGDSTWLQLRRLWHVVTVMHTGGKTPHL